MNVHIQFFALCREKAGCEKATLELPPESTLEVAKSHVVQAYPELGVFSASLIFAVNGKYADESTILNEDDTIACFPPVSGG